MCALLVEPVEEPLSSPNVVMQQQENITIGQQHNGTPAASYLSTTVLRMRTLIHAHQMVQHYSTTNE